MKPMLAHHFSPKRATFPCYGQPKLNGIRAIWLQHYLLSRGYGEEVGVEWAPHVLPHIFNALQILTKRAGLLRLDGELYCHGLSLQQINRRVAVKRVGAHEHIREIRYNVFDIVHHNPFSRRVIALNNLNEFIKHDPELNCALSVVPTTLLNTPAEAELFYKLQKREGFEGAMYRDPSMGYGFSANCSNKENRWKCLLKRKEELDMECIIVGMERGKAGGQFQDVMGALVLELPNGRRFNSGSGVQIQHRHLIEAIIDELVENKTRVRILYDELSDNGIPLRNRIECIYDERFS